jgi:flagellar basal-body rod protein FlgG
MFRALNVAATGMAAQETNLDTLSDNLANANTTGFKREQAEFEDLLYQNVRVPGISSTGAAMPVGVQLGSGSRVVSTARSFSEGTILQTGNQLDLAIEGQGFFGVQQPDGSVAYTRNGSLQLDAQGRLVTGSGLPIEPGITIPTNATSVTIGADGTVSVTQPGNTTPNQVGKITLSNFPNPAGLNALGHNLFVATASSGDAVTATPGTDGLGTIMQNALEGSNVDVVTEMVNLIRTQRAYEVNSKVISAADEMLQKATQTQ